MSRGEVSAYLIDFFQPTISIELVDNEREYWQSKDKRGRDAKKVMQTELLAYL